MISAASRAIAVLLSGLDAWVIDLPLDVEGRTEFHSRSLAKGSGIASLRISCPRDRITGENGGAFPVGIVEDLARRVNPARQRWDSA